MKILYLNIKKIWFDLMINQKKNIEYRKNTAWIQSRLINKHYDYIKFINGYGNNKPYFICKFLNYEISKKNYIVSIDKHKISVQNGDFLIYLGSIIETGNLDKI